MGSNPTSGATLQVRCSLVSNEFPEIEHLQTEKVMYLTTTGRKTGKPHTVEIWFAYAGGKVFASHEREHPDWMKNLEKNERVQIKIKSLKFEAIASIVKDGESLELGKKSLYEKYYHPAPKVVIDDWFSLSTVVEMTPEK